MGKSFHRHIGFYNVLYILFPYTNPTPKPTHHAKLSAIFDFQNRSFFMIYKLVSFSQILCDSLFRSFQLYKHRTSFYTFFWGLIYLKGSNHGQQDLLL